MLNKKIPIIVCIFILIFVSIVTVYKISTSHVKYFKGEVIKIETEDHHLVFTVKENEVTQYVVCVRPIKLINYRDTNEEGYAHNIEIGDYIEGNYYNDWFHKSGFAENIVVG